MKKILFLMLLAFLSSTQLWADSKAVLIDPCPPAEGDGTKNNQYKITSACELVWYVQNFKAGDYAILDADISLGDIEWAPIGTRNKPYNGNFDGRNHYISNFTVKADTAGFFGYASGAKIENIKVRDAEVEGTKYAGIICGYAKNTNIIACDNEAAVKGIEYVGGICGFLDNATISNCNNAGEVEATGNYVGGVAGYLNSANIEQCVNSKSVSSEGDYVGGVAGYIKGTSSKKSSIKDCRSRGIATVSGKSYVAGLCGYVEYGDLAKSTNAGAVKATGTYVGGVAGYLENATLDQCANNKSVSSEGNYVGGVAGYIKGSQTAQKPVIIINCSSSKAATVHGKSYVGGLCGCVEYGTMSTSTNAGAVYGTGQETGGLIGSFKDNSTAADLYNYGYVHSTSSQVGGVIGSSKTSKVTTCANTGTVDATNDRNIGGVIGNAEQTEVTSCLNIGQINGKNYTGGVVGYNYNYSKILYCANYGMVSGAERVGGITGEARANMENSMSTGYVKGTGSYVGGICGYLNSDDYSVSCYYDNQMCTVKEPFGYSEGNGDGKGVPTKDLVSGVFKNSNWTEDTNGYPRPKAFASMDFAAAGASAIVLADGDDAEHFSKQANLKVVNNANWSSKGGVQIAGTTATPSVKGPDTLYASKGDYKKIVPLNVTSGQDAVIKYTVTFKDWDGTVLATQQVEKGKSATPPANPTREGYTFDRWDKDFTNVQSDLIVTALYIQNIPGTTYYTVTFKDWDGKVLATQQVEKGKSATPPANPTREGYTFIGWDKDFTNVQSNLIVTAKYQKNGSASSFVGFESTNSHSLATQIYSEGLVQNISNVALVETDAASHKYSINLVNGGEGTFSMGGVVFSYTNAEAGKTAYKTYVQYIQPNGSDREIRIPTEKGQQVKVVLVEACAGILVDGVSKDFVAGENVLTSQNGTIVLKNGSAKPKISAILPLNSVGPTDAITVRLKASSAAGWSKVNLYYWGEGVTSPAWPGVTIKEDAEGWYSYTFASVTSVNIIWNDGNNQTQDISNVTESTCYSLKSTSGKTIGVNVVECEAAASVSVTGVSLNKKTLQMVVGNTATLTASVLPTNASNKSVTWTSSNTATATISSTGTISAKAEGVTTITCKTIDGNFTAECYVVVSEVNSEYTFSYEPTNATVINYTATELSYNEIPENNCVFAILADNAHTLNLMYVGSLVNGAIPQGNYKITSTLQNGTFCYSVGGDDQYDYGSYLATDFNSEGYYTSAYYIIAGDIIIGGKNNYTVKLVSVNGTDINVSYTGPQDVEIVPSEIKASKILRDGQIYILRGEKVYNAQGALVK